jgi:multidrug efflux system membrane fusion protein
MVAKLQAEAAYAADYLGRVERLVDRQFVTADKVAEARSRRDASAAAVQEAQRRLRAAEAAVEYDVAQRRGAARAVEQSRHDVARAQDLLAQIGDVNARIQAAEASVRAAELDVGYCRVTAPFDAYVTNLNIAVGEYARQGQQIFALVDNRAWYVLANFRETYMSSIKPGMEADVYLLSYPGRRFRGVVQGIGWANKPQDGTTVGVLPDVQQTLNWVRLANRFQVRVRLEEQDAERPFRMGTTAVVTIRGFPPGTSSASAPR